MSWSYNPAQIATMPIYQVRLLIGDTKTGDPQMQDEEIAFYVNGRATIYGAAADCCRTLATQMSREADSVQGDLRTTYSSKARSYRMMAADYSTKASVGAVPYAGGTSIADKINQEQNTDRVAPAFNVGMMDNFLPVAPAGNESGAGASEAPTQAGV